MIESGLWATMKKNWSPLARVIRIENTCGLGTPDVYGALDGRSFWIELKLIKGFPKRSSTVVRIDHFTSDQKLWLETFGRAQIFCWLFVQVSGVGYFLFDWKTAQDIGKMTAEEWKERAILFFLGRCDWRMLLAVCLGLSRK